MIKTLIRALKQIMGDSFRKLNNSYLRACGIEIGRGCMISLRAKIDTRRGKVAIGDNCVITYGSVILSHDRSAKHLNPADTGAGSVTLGNNVYIGVNSVVLRNVTIGENSVIGAGSVVTKDIPANSVAVGNPAHVIKQI